MNQVRVPAVIMRGGTSKGVFFKREHLPASPEDRDRFILRAFGSPDPNRRQIDGLGGSYSTTSKVVIIGRSSVPDCDVDYLFGQVSIDKPLVDYSGSCGNLSVAVGPYAIEEGLVEATDPVTRVRIWQVNTQKKIIAHVPTAGGMPVVEGDFHVDGLPFPGAEIKMEYLEPGGACSDSLLPTGQARDQLEVPGFGKVWATLVDATSPAVLVKAEDIGLKGYELPAEIDDNREILRILEGIRAAAAVAMGLTRTPEEATKHRPATPKIAFVAPAADYTNLSGETVKGESVDIVSRIMSMGTLHRAHAVTGAVALAMATLIPGSVPNEVAGIQGTGYRDIRIGHPSGVITVGAEVAHREGQWTAVRAVTSRTARRLMDGWVYVPKSVWSGPDHGATAVTETRLRAH